MNNAYVYRHIRLDTNEVFYVGIGIQAEYARASSKIGRSKHWLNIMKTVPCEIEIVMDGLTWDQASEKEIELISLYGRRDIGTGTLLNLTNGGDGANGCVRDEETRKRISLGHMGQKPWNKGIKITPEHSKKLSELRKGKNQGTDNHFFGKKHTDETKEKMRLKTIGRPGNRKGMTKKVIDN